jgi:hypothetical protein
MVVDEIDVEGVTLFEPENQPPVSGDGHAPKTSQLTLQRMQTPAGKQRDVRESLGRIDDGENIADLRRLTRRQSGDVIGFKEAPQLLALEASDRGQV